MDTTKQKLLIEHADKKLDVFKCLDSFIIPNKGWIYILRKALNMSSRQLGKKLEITAQSAQELELREENGTITINSLKEAGRALNMKLVYGFIPNEESIEKMIEKRAFELASEIVNRTSNSMSLENQENSNERIRKAISIKTEEFKNKIPKKLWD